MAAQLDLSCLIGTTCSLSNNEEERKISNLSLEPFASARIQKLFTPSVKLLCIETMRQATALSMKVPKSSHYLNDKCYKWLFQNPIAHHVDIAFLVEEKAKFKTEVEAAASKAKAKKTLHWIDNDPFLCLYHCLINDTIKAAFLDCDNVLNCEELDARNLDKRPKTFEQEAAELFNDATFAPISLHLPSVHLDFDEPKVLCIEDMPGIITPDEVKS
jgi:hypothetical protein